jgi:integrase/recombinase XerD
MSVKKNLRADNTYYITNDKGINPKLGARVLHTGVEHLFLEYYLGCEMVYSVTRDRDVCEAIRKREYLQNMFLHSNPSTPLERQQNKEILALAMKIRETKQREMVELGTGFALIKDMRTTNYLEFMQDYLDSYTKRDKGMIKMALNRFKDFLKDTPEYNRFCENLPPNRIDKDMMMYFAEYLQSRSKGEGAKSVWQRFKKMINYALDHKILTENPCKGVTVNVDDGALVKDVLTADEFEKLVSTHYTFESDEIRKAAIFSYYSGLRWCDVSAITFSAIDYQRHTFTIDQAKTRGHSNKSIVTNPIPLEVLGMIGKPKTDHPETELVFNLPSYNAAETALQRWVKKAGIDKHITWHCLRHSVATELLRQGANIKVVAEYLGHSKLNFVNKYIRALAEDKTKAVKTLPKLKL